MAKKLPCDYRDMFMERGYSRAFSEDLSCILEDLYDTNYGDYFLSYGYGEELEDLIAEVMLSTNYVVADKNHKDENGRRQKRSETPKDILRKLGLDESKVEDSWYSYISVPRLNEDGTAFKSKRNKKDVLNEDGKLYNSNSIDRYIMLPPFFNFDNPQFRYEFIKSLSKEIDTYVSEYSIKNGKLSKRNIPIGFEEGINSYRATNIVKSTFDDTFTGPKNSETYSVAGMFYPNLKTIIDKSMALNTDDLKEYFASNNLDYNTFMKAFDTLNENEILRKKDYTGTKREEYDKKIAFSKLTIMQMIKNMNLEEIKKSATL